jgi:signal transduction histidine kinase
MQVKDTRRLLPVIAPVGATGVALIAIAAVAFARSGPSASRLAGVAALLAAAVIAEAFPVPIERVSPGAMSLATVFIVASAALYGWAAGTIVGFLTMALVEVGRRRQTIRLAYNAGLYVLSAAGAGAVRDAIGTGGLVETVLATIGATAAFYVIDIGLLAVVIARERREGVVRLFPRYVSATLAPLGVMASVTLILVILWQRAPALALVLVAPLALVVFYQRSVHASLARLRELDRLKDEFIAIVSHELRTPLASVYGAALTLQRHELEPESRDSMLAIIYRESDRLARLVNDVLWVNRLETGRVETRIESCEPVVLAESVIEAARAHLPPGLALELAPSADVPPVAADADKVEQVLGNLIENAVKYSPNGGCVEVSVAPGEGSVTFAVRDEGIGIPPDEHARIFEKFHRLDPNLTNGVSGTGLGLYIARELVQQMNGRIWVMSEAGQGSTFAFELPAADRAATTA